MHTRGPFVQGLAVRPVARCLMIRRRDRALDRIDRNPHANHRQRNQPERQRPHQISTPHRLTTSGQVTPDGKPISSISDEPTSHPMRPITELYAHTSGARRLLVVDLGFLGDTVHLIPALWELRRHYPAAEIHVVTTPLGAAVLTLTPWIRRVWTIELEKTRRSTWAQLRTIRALRRAHFDLAVNFTGADRTLILMGLTGARHRVARVPDRWHFWNPWLIRHWIPQPDRQQPVFEQRRIMLAACGLPIDGSARFNLEIPEEATRWAAEQIPAQSIHLSLSASTPIKEWPLERWIELGRQLVIKFPQSSIVVTSDRKSTRLNSSH